MRRGTTLLELALAVVMIGLILTVSLPRLAAVVDGLAVQRAALDIVSAHRRARVAAILRSEVLELVVAADSLVIRPRDGGDVLWRAHGPAADGVALAGTARTLTFSPVGLTLGLSNASFLLSRGTATRTVIVSRLGRVRVTP
jgi:Tfp pilus assembly protein FimT